MVTFPAASDYHGTVRGAREAHLALASQAVFSGSIVVTSWTREEVAPLVPDPLVLAEPREQETERHPVVFLFGHQRYGAPIFGRLAFPTPVVYEEFTMAVPYVRHRDARSLHLYLPRMICSYAPATWTGNAFYGFGKRMGRLEWRGPICAVCDAEGRLLAHVQLEREAESAGVPPNFDAIRGLLEPPVAGRRDDGRWVESYWSFDFARARVAAADALVTIDRAFADGLRPGTHPDLPAGSLHVRDVVWRLSLPTPLRP